MNNNSGKQQSVNDREIDEQQQSNDDMGFAARLRDLIVGDGDGDSDLLMQRNSQQGDGRCRADERLKPLLKVNASSGVEDRLLSHLSQHFEPLEVGLLARCLCIPLASVRVGKIKKQGTLLTPISTRGNLVISLLPTSDLRISFLSDDGYTETLSMLRNTSDCSSVMIEGMPADSSGRSFVVRIPNKAPQISPPYYCWCPPVVSVSALQTESFTLPPLSSLLPKPSPNLSEIPFLPLSMSASSQVFTPLMCDPIVHLPVINTCSSGQAYLVSSGPAITVSIPPLVEESTESEKSARDTLRVLISGSGEFPSIVAQTDGVSLVSPGIMRCIEQGESGGSGLNKDDSSEEGSRE